MVRDLPKEYYPCFKDLINEQGGLKEETTYRIKMRDSEILNTQGKNQVEYLDITFRKGTHIELVRRGMNRWLVPYLPDDTSPKQVWAALNYPELMEWK